MLSAMIHCLLIIITCSALKTTNLSTDQSALLALKLHITSDPHEFLSKNWSEVSSVCDWAGVKCGSRHRRVAALDVSSMNLTGTVPPQLGNLSFLVYLDMHGNNFHGGLPEELSRLRRLRVMNLWQNSLAGEVPMSFGHLSVLRSMVLCDNNFTGAIPDFVSNLSKLETLDLYSNSLEGAIPEQIGNLPRLRCLILEANQLTGFIPPSIFNFTKLEILSLSDNHLFGSLPVEICRGQFPSLKLRTIHLASNQLHGRIPPGLSQCSELRVLSLTYNNFTGKIPKEMGNLQLLEELYLGGNHLEGVIPSEIGNLSRIIGIKLDENQLTGVIPESVKDLQSLQLFSLSNNKLGGYLDMLCGLRSLAFLHLSQNHFSGSIPECFGDMTALRDIFLGSNRLTSTIPKNLWNLSYLLRLELTSNYISGSLAQEMGNLAVVIAIDLSWNNISGNILFETCEMRNLAHLNLANNHLTGPIPELFELLVSLESLNLSNNNLTGVIPKSLETLRYLSYFNVSFNHLRGEIPSGGPFRNFTSESFMSNEDLCGEPKFHVLQCLLSSSRESRANKLLQILFSLLGIVSVITIVTTFLYLRFRRKYAIPIEAALPLSVTTPWSDYYDALWEATNGYDEANLLGSGSFGSVYKATTKDGKLVAVKVFKLQYEESVTSFREESRVLSRISHRNLVKIISWVDNLDFKALVIEYMQNGNLEKWLYSGDHYLNIVQRLNIMIDVANALQYLHHEYLVPLVHCDVKPTILLDGDMVGRLGDFGISKFLGIDKSITFTKTWATFGYIAPEYGSYGLVSTKCDVYSFGIVLMEVFTARKPNDEIFGGRWNLKGWVAKSMPNQILQVADAKLFEEDEQHQADKLDCLSSIMDLALSCVVESHMDRINIRDIVAVLKRIKYKFVCNIDASVPRGIHNHLKTSTGE